MIRPFTIGGRGGQREARHDFRIVGEEKLGRTLLEAHRDHPLEGS